MTDKAKARPRITDAEWSFLRSFPGRVIAVTNAANPEFYRVTSMEQEVGPHGFRISTTISTVLGLVAKGYVELVPNEKYSLYVRYTDMGREELQRAGVSLEPAPEPTPIKDKMAVVSNNDAAIADEPVAVGNGVTA